MSSEWVPVPGFSFEVTAQGQVRRPGHVVWQQETIRRAAHYRVFRPRLVVPRVGHGGYLFVDALDLDKGRTYPVGVHRLVALAFHGEPPVGKPLALHRDGMPAHNTKENVYWGDYQENSVDAMEHGTLGFGETGSAAKLTELQAKEIKSRHANGEGVKSLAAAFGLSRSGIQYLVSGRSWKHLK